MAEKIIKPIYLTGIDFHSHILPRIDDGAESIQKSLKLINKAVKCGVTKIIATPHFYANRIDVETFIARRQKAFDLLLEQNPAIPIELGAEVLLFSGLENMERIEELVMSDGETLLLELPLSEFIITDDYYYTVEALAKRFRVVLAHANRYSDYTVLQMIEAGALIQVNAEDLRSRRERIRVRRWMNSHLLYALGSDAHRKPSVYRYFKRALKYLK